MFEFYQKILRQHDMYDVEKRPYHNINHLEDLFYKCESAMKDVPIFILDAIIFHDIVPDVDVSADIYIDWSNQYREKEIANKSLVAILKSKNHEYYEDCSNEWMYHVNFFLDADMSILGENPLIYNKYKKTIRKEYPVPYNLFKRERIKFLSSFNGFKTNHFILRYQDQAFKNINQEILEL